ncbi:MAG: hypothetical protein V2I48_09440 [Xanthomonadales bacterium]|jgi:hypothetical protein|nr:hypothetical protein [Xanthomonadales bacterium]
MKRRGFLKSSLIVGGASVAPLGLAAGAARAGECKEALNAVQGLEELGRIKPKSSSQVKNSYWGIQAGAFDDDTLEKARDIGVKWSRINIHWDRVEKEKDVFDWAPYDTSLDALLRYDIVPFVSLTGGNGMYTGTGTYDDPKLAAIYGDSPLPPLDDKGKAGWLNFVTTAVNRYKDRIRHWEVWNEPNHRNYWGAPPDGEVYGELVRYTVDRILSLHPEAKIIAGSMAGISADFTDKFLSRCDPQKIDVISFHNYGNRPENRVYAIEKFKKVLDSYRLDFEIWQGECGIASTSRTTGYRSTGPWGPAIQAKWLLRQSFVDTWFCHATLSNYFKLFDDGELEPESTVREPSGPDQWFGAPERNGSRMHANGVNAKCLLSVPDRRPKLAYYAYQNLCAAMDDSFARAEPAYRFRVVDPGQFHGIGEFEDAFPSVPLLAAYQSKDAAFLAYWLPWIPQEYVADFAMVSLEVRAEFKEPVLLDLLSGSVYAINPFEKSEGMSQFAALPLADFPLAIAERSTLDLKSSI